MKKTFFTLALAAAVALTPTAAFAAEATAPATSSVAISLATLDGLVRQYNPSALVLYNNLMIAKQKYTDAKAYDSDEDIYNIGHQYDLVEATYESQVQQVIVGAKQAYLNYWHAVSVQAADQMQADQDAKLLAYDKGCWQNGSLSQADYQTATDNAAKSVQTLAAQNAAVVQAEQSLNAEVPVPAGVSVDILAPADADFDFSMISRINYANDDFSMNRKNETIQSATLDYEFTRDNAYVENSDETIAKAKQTLDQTIQQQESSFLSLYNSVTSSYAAYQTELQTYQRKAADQQLDAQRVKLGYLSQKACDQNSLNLQTLKNTLENDRNSLYIIYAEYVGMVNGYSSGSTGT